ncbi:MAG: hypothetical protein KAJ40_07870, partial [Alphaproteobacteria bacterium]|nr:hypothetical protein [Alphaproteobacteria bacterium]
RENNDALVKALDKEKENNIAYRRKIVEYQAELAQRKEVEQASSSGVHRASIFERHIKALEQKQQQAENRSSELKLENQELKARMELLSASIKDNLFDDIQPASGHSFIKDNNKGYSSIKEAPPVLDSKDTQDLSKDEEESSIKGVLKEHSAANEVSADNGRLAVNDNFLDAEVLLATGLLPLQ